MQAEGIKKLLQQSSLFGALPEAVIDKLEKKFSTLSFKLGQTALQRGDTGEAFYVIHSGKARVVDDTDDKPVTLATLVKGDSFGEQSLLYKKPVSRTVRAAGNLILLKLSAADFDLLIHELPALKKHLEKRVEQHNEFNFLKTLKILSSLTPKEAQVLLKSIETISLKEGDFLFHEDSPGDTAYIIREGKIRIIKESADNKMLAILRSGALIGEMSLLDSQPRTAGAVSVGETTILCLSKEAFDRVASKSPNFRELIVKQATNRLLQQDALLTSSETLSEEPTQEPTLKVSRVQVGEGLLARTYPFIQVETSVLAGLSCLSMINHFYGQEDKSQQFIEQQLQRGQPDTLVTMGRKAEAQGYMTRLLYLDEKGLALPPFPAIVEEADGQLSVIFSVSKAHVVLANPLTGVEQISRETFLKTWNGQLLTVTYVPNFGSVGTEVKKLFKQFLPMIRPYRDLMIGVGLVSLAIQLLGLAGPLFSRAIIDKVLVHGDSSLLFLMLIGMFFVTGFQLASSTLREFLLTHALKRMSASLLIRFFKHILSLPQKFFSKWKVGDFTLRFNENEKLLELMSQSGLTIILDSITILFYFVVLLGMNAKLTGAALIFVMAYGVMIVISTPMLRANDRRVFECQTEVQSHLIETVTGVDTIKAMAAEELFFQQGINLIVQSKLAEFKGALLGFNIGLISTLINQASTITILGYGALLTLKGDLTTGELIAFNAMLGLLLTPLMGLIGVWDELQEMRIAFERINDVLELPSEHQDEMNELPPMEGHVHFEDVSFRYDGSEKEILAGINMEVLPGQKIALVGRSGSGKTTLVNLLIKLLEPTDGKIYIDNRDISDIELSSLRRQLGVVEQSPFLFSGTIRENIAKADPTAGLERVVAASMLAGAHDFIQELPMGYDTQVGERGMTLSGGQKQRLIIARSVLTNPRILILDEATAALDTESERLIQQNLDELMTNRTAFIIAHRLSTVRNADQIMVIDQGRIVESGTHEQLMEQQGLYFYLNTKGEASSFWISS